MCPLTPLVPETLSFIPPFFNNSWPDTGRHKFLSRYHPSILVLVFSNVCKACHVTYNRA